MNEADNDMEAADSNEARRSKEEREDKVLLALAAKSRQREEIVHLRG